MGEVFVGLGGAGFLMGAFLLYALLPNEKDSTGKNDAQVSEKTGNPKDGKNDKPQT